MTMELTQKPWYKKWWAITLFIFFGLIMINLLAGNDNSINHSDTSTLQKQATQGGVKEEPDSTINQVIDESKSEQIQESSIPKEGGELTHDQLLAISNESGVTVIGKSYQMTLYLEQSQTNTQAEFMTQPNDNSMDTILITCNMKSSDLYKLDGESAQKRIYKPYNLQLTFIKYDHNVGLYYEANCTLK